MEDILFWSQGGLKTNPWFIVISSLDRLASLKESLGGVGTDHCKGCPTTYLFTRREFLEDALGSGRITVKVSNNASF